MMGKNVDKKIAYKRLELLVKRFRNELGNGDISGSHPLTTEEFKPTEEGKKFNESQVRQGFVLPMFRDVLGWDIDNSINEVIPELHNHEGFADFVFVRNNQRKYVLETKKPYVNIDPSTQSGRDGVRQSIGYASSLKDVNMALVSNFECLVFSHSYTMPKKGEENKNVLEWFHFSQLLDKDNFEILWQFRFEACGEKDFCPDLLDRIDNNLIKKRKTIDQNLLDDLKSIRVLLANNMSGILLDIDTADTVTQHLINRIIFTRVLEDRGIINNRLNDLCSAENVWKSLRKRFSDVFAKFPIEVLNVKSKSLLDSNSLEIENDALVRVIEMLYDRGPKHYHDCYDFKYIPSDILGYAYEHSIAFKLKMHKREFALDKKKFFKNGVHYTPAYICKNLTNKTLSRSLERKKDKKLENIKCIDIACGSGSFLTSLYDSLYRKKYLESKTNNSLSSDGSKEVVSLTDRKSLIEKCIYGIDIDNFAVGVSKLSLYLKFFEDFPIGKGKLNKDEIPNLEENIICADSLLDTTMKHRFPAKHKAINKSNKKIYDIIKNKKADVVVGNPPYIKIQDLKKIEDFSVDLYQKFYEKSIGKGSVEFAIAFIERAMNILSDSGDVGFIIPNKIFKNKQGIGIRDLITSHVSVNLSEFVDFNSVQIFDASIYTCLLHLSRKSVDQFKCIQVYRMEDGAFLLDEAEKVNKKFPSNDYEVGMLNISDISSAPWNLLVGIKRDIFMNLAGKFNAAKSVVPQGKIFQGIPTGSDKIFIVELVKKKSSKIWEVTSEALQIKSLKDLNDNSDKKVKKLDKIPTIEIEPDYLVPMYRGSTDLKHFNKQESDSFLIYPYDPEGKLIKNSTFKRSKTYKYLNRNEHRNGIKGPKNKVLLQGLDERENGKFSGSQFYQYSRPQNLDLWSGEKIMFPYMVERFNAHLDTSHAFVNVSTGGYAVIAPETREEKLFMLSIMNSDIFNFLVKCFSGDFRGGWFECSNQYVGAAPFPEYSEDYDMDYDEIEETIEGLYAASQVINSKESKSEALLNAKSEFHSFLDWLNDIIAEIYELKDEELEIIEFYSSGVSDVDAQSRAEDLVNLANTIKEIYLNDDIEAA